MVFVKHESDTGLWLFCRGISLEIEYMFNAFDQQCQIAL